VRFAEGFGTEVLGHDYLLCQRSDEAYSIINFSLLQLVGRKSGQIPAVGVIPHTMRSSSKRLNPAFDEVLNQLETGHLFPRRGSQSPNLIHQRLRDQHFLFGQLMRP
jgi:hypothetical protein